MRIYYSITNAVTDPTASLLVFKSQVVGTPTARIYKDGSTPPSFSSMTDLGTGWSLNLNTTDYGLYIFEFKDDNHSSGIILGKMHIYAHSSCDNGATTSVAVTSTGVLVTTPGDSVLVSASIDGGATFKPGTVGTTVSTCFWFNSELDTMGFTTKVNSVIIRRPGCADREAGIDFNIDDIQPLVVTPIVSNVTTHGGSDGSITLSLLEGSGSFTFSWADGPTIQNRVGLEAATYTVTVTDIITGQVVVVPIQVTEPELVPAAIGTFLTVPMLNSLTFVIDQAIDECTNHQNLDNRLFVDQYFEGISQNEQNYFQRVNKCDALATQFNSDFNTFEVLLRKYCDGTVVKSFPYLLMQQNIGATDDFALQIQNHTVFGQTRVYFGIGVPPVPLTVGESFQILNNVNFNGVYSIVSIENDTIKGYQYIVINKTFTGAAIQTATGRFVTTTANFDVFESQHDFTDVADGKYYVTIRAYDENSMSPDIVATSEPIDLAVSHPETNLIRYRNIDNAFDFTWATGYLGLLRVPSHFGNKRQPKSDRTTSRDADYSLVKVSVRKSRIVTFTAWDIPPYLHEKLSCAFDCDSVTLNNQICQTSDDYDPDEPDDYTMLSKGTVKVEVKWFSDYNSDDIGSVQDGGFLKTESGFLKR